MRRSLLFPIVTSTHRCATGKGGAMIPFASLFRVLCLLVVCIFSMAGLGQNSGTIQGTVTDPQGAVVAGATVQAIDEAKGVVVRDTTSNAEGLFVLHPLQPGNYTVRVEAKG